jgi:hypothetical protein
MGDKTILGRTRTGGSPGPDAPGAPRTAHRPAAGPAQAIDPIPDGTTPEGPHPDRSPEERRERRLFASVLTVAFLVLVAAIALAFTLGAEQSGPPSLPTTLSAHPGSPGSAPPSAHLPRGQRAIHQSTSARSGATGTGTAPAVISLSPAQGGPGQAVTVSGSNFLSADGQIVVRFAGVVASTNCPVQTSCTVVVPTLAGAPRSVRVTVTTESGTSSGLAFEYR